MEAFGGRWRLGGSRSSAAVVGVGGVAGVEVNVFEFGAAPWVSYWDGLSAHQFEVKPTSISTQFVTLEHHEHPSGQAPLLRGLLGRELCAEGCGPLGMHDGGASRRAIRRLSFTMVGRCGKRFGLTRGNLNRCSGTVLICLWGKVGTLF